MSVSIKMYFCSGVIYGLSWGPLLRFATYGQGETKNQFLFEVI